MAGQRQGAVIALVLSALLLAGTGAQAQTSAPDQVPWSKLSDQEQNALLPLQERWAGLDAIRQKKWLTVARRFQEMNPDEQNRLQEKMAAWAALTPEQRRMARDRYKALSKIHPDARETLKHKWAEYDALSAKEKGVLARPTVVPQPQRSLATGQASPLGTQPPSIMTLIPQPSSTRQ